MRKLLTLTFIALMLAAGNALAVIDWAGQAYPNDGAAVVPTGDQFVVAQVFKGGVTDAAGQGADITATLFYTTDIAAEASVAMTYNVDAGASNDEYIGFIPQTALVGATTVAVTVVFEDLTDSSTYEIAGDQMSNPPPLTYNIVDVTPNDIDVTFTICMEGVATAGPVCVVGNHAAIGNWSAGAMMTNTYGDVWEATVTFPAGTNPAIEYKFRKDVCTTWEGTANRALLLPTDGTTEMDLLPDTWEFAPLGCGFGNVLTEDKVVCIQVCMTGVDSNGSICVTGGHDLLTNWGTGVQMAPIGGGLYQACLIFPAGSAYPITAEYKFRKDGCDTWEGTANRAFTVEETSVVEQTLTSAWEDGPGACVPVPSETHSWGSVKGMYR
ncbi:MAG: hypothetical protein GY838_14120 [bacterium]|nr:hypothetical protein [bacterium]